MPVPPEAHPVTELEAALSSKGANNVYRGPGATHVESIFLIVIPWHIPCLKRPNPSRQEQDVMTMLNSVLYGGHIRMVCW